MKIAIIRKPIFIVSSILILFLFCNSCVPIPIIPTTDSVRGPIDDERISSIKVGTTTKEDVLLKFGYPSDCEGNLCNYCWRIAYGHILWIIPLGGGPLCSGNCLSIWFDENGIVEKYEVKNDNNIKHYGAPCR